MAGTSYVSNIDEAVLESSKRKLLSSYWMVSYTHIAHYRNMNSSVSCGSSTVITVERCDKGIHLIRLYWTATVEVIVKYWPSSTDR